MDTKFGFCRVTAVSNKVVVADPMANASEHISIIKRNSDSDIILFPELSISGYTCGELFHQNVLLGGCLDALQEIKESVDLQLVVVGMPLAVDNALYNCAVVLNHGSIVGVVPKAFIPNYGEFYEGRWFAPGEKAIVNIVNFGYRTVPFGTDLIFDAEQYPALRVFVEICESIWMPVPPSSFAAIAGANILLNPSASNETVGKSSYRENLVVGQSGRCIAGYVYASSGPTESTADVVFGGHCLIAESGHVLGESRRVGDGRRTPNRDSYWITRDIDIQMLQKERRTTTSYNNSVQYLTKPFQTIGFNVMSPATQFLRANTLEEDRPRRIIDATPFVPKREDERTRRCAEIFGIQTCALAKRIEVLPKDTVLSIGISGGLDSTLALLVAVKTATMLNMDKKRILGITMPGFGTTDHTLTNARMLMKHLGISTKELDIRAACYQEMLDIQHKPFGAAECLGGGTLDMFQKFLANLPSGSQDLVFENIQARRRTELLMAHGFVLGTGDMSELFLGWCTYNGDHQSMYNVNCSIPKTLVKWLVRYVATEEMDSEGRSLLLSICDTTISPELLPPGKDGSIAQSTEEKIGPYELHDFAMYHIVRNGFSPEKILYLGGFAEGWSKKYSEEERRKWLQVAYQRFFSQQYKREDVPNGPKVGSVSLSPRGDWRMPPDASVAAWIRNLE